MPESDQIKAPVSNWLSIKQATEIYPLGRSSFYNLMEKGLIRTTTTRVNEHQRYGRRLINRASIDAFFEERASGGTEINS